MNLSTANDRGKERKGRPVQELERHEMLSEQERKCIFVPSKIHSLRLTDYIGYFHVRSVQQNVPIDSICLVPKC